MATAKRLVRVRRDLPLPPSNSKSVRSRAKRLLDGASLMNEFERLFEVIDTLKVEGGVTRQSLQQALKASSSMTAMRAADDTTDRFLAGSVAHKVCGRVKYDGYGSGKGMCSHTAAGGYVRALGRV